MTPDQRDMLLGFLYASAFDFSRPAAERKLSPEQYQQIAQSETRRRTWSQKKRFAIMNELIALGFVTSKDGRPSITESGRLALATLHTTSETTP